MNQYEKYNVYTQAALAGGTCDLPMATTALGGNDYVTIKSKLLDAGTGEPLAFANVYQEDNSINGVTTDLDGNFVINLPSASNLVLSFLGYQTQTIKAIEVSDAIYMNESVEQLSDVTVTAPQSNKKKTMKYVGYGALALIVLLAFTRKQKPVKASI